MAEPTPRVPAGGPIEVVSARAILRSAGIRHRSFASMRRLPGGRLLLVFRLGSGPRRREDGAVMLTRSDDDGQTWEEPIAIYAYPGWDCMPMGGLWRYEDGTLELVVGRLQMDLSLAGDEPITGWYTTATESRDDGRSWSEPRPEIRLFPVWTELFGASNPHRLSDGRYMLAVMGTTGRDTGWRAGATFRTMPDPRLPPPTIIAAADDRNYSDIDVIRLDDGRFLAVIREHVTRDSVFSHSADEGRTWTPVRLTGFKGANVKLIRLRSGAILCAYRDGNPARLGVSCSVSEDGGASWRFVGQLYAADPATDPRVESQCGYPDIARAGERELLAVLHAYPDAAGRVDLHFLRLRDLT